MRQDDIGGLFAYWNRLRGPRAAPERREIAPAAISRWLPDTFMLQATASGEPRFRLAGTRICAIYGRELRALPFAALWQPKDRATMQRLVRNVTASKRIVRIDGESRSARGRRAPFRLVLLPLANEVNDRHLMGMLRMIGKPFWLESDAIVENHIKIASILDPREDRPEATTSAQTAEGTDQTSHNTSHLLASRKIGHLRIIDGGKAIGKHAG